MLIFNMFVYECVYTNILNRQLYTEYEFEYFL